MHCMNCGQKITSENIEVCVVCGKHSGHITPKTMRQRVISQEKAVQLEKERIENEMLERLADTTGDWEKKMEYIYEPMDALDGIISEFTKKITKDTQDYNPVYKVNDGLLNGLNKDNNKHIFPNNENIEIKDLTNNKNVINEQYSNKNNTPQSNYSNYNSPNTDIPSTIITKEEVIEDNNNNEIKPIPEKKPINEIPYLYVVSGEDDEKTIQKDEQETKSAKEVIDEQVEKLQSSKNNHKDNDVKEYIPNSAKNHVDNDVKEYSPGNKNNLNEQQPQYGYIPEQQLPYGYMQGQQPPYMQGQQPPYMQGQQPPFMQVQQPPYMQGQQPQYMQGQQPQYMQGQQPQYMQGQQPPFMQGQQNPYPYGKSTKSLYDDNISNQSVNTDEKNKKNKKRKNVDKVGGIQPLKPSELPQPNQNNMPNNIPNNMPNNIPNNMPNNIPNNMPNNIPSNMPNNITNNIQNNIPNNMPNNIPNNMTNNIPNNMPNNIPSNMPNNIPNNMPNNIPNNMPNNIPNNMPNNMAQNNNYTEVAVKKPQKLSESSTKVFMFSLLSFSTLFAICIGIFVLIPRDFKIEDGILVEYTGRDTVVQIPNKVNQIGDGVFENLSFIEEIIIPNSVTSIGDLAFANCTSLVNVEFHENIEYVGENALIGVPLFAGYTFEGSRLVEYKGNDVNIVIPEFVTSIGDKAFFNNDVMQSVTLPPSLHTIGEVAFSSCDSLTSIVIPNGTTTISNSAFSGCSNLSDITIPDTVSYIGSDAFSGTSWYNSLAQEFNIYGNNVLIKYIGRSAEVIIPDNVTSIGNAAFRNNSDIKSVTIPSKVTEIGYQAFSGCSLLDTVIMEEGVTVISEGAFLGCYALKNIEFPSTIMSVKRMSLRTTWWYQNNYNKFGIVGGNTLVKYTGDDIIFAIPEEILYISAETFASAVLVEAIILPETIIHIDENTFLDLPSLEKIYCVKDSYVDKYFKNNESLAHITITYEQ